ncbi:hypothetical protein PI126_g7446 [Phytophthora idaei]|nr:hypothetical protein PI126_g7446 [Phytophthora idaei]
MTLLEILTDLNLSISPPHVTYHPRDMCLLEVFRHQHFQNRSPHAMSTEVKMEDVIGDWEVNDVGEIDTSGVVATGDGGAASDADTATEDCVVV